MQCLQDFTPETYKWKTKIYDRKKINLRNFDYSLLSSSPEATIGLGDFFKKVFEIDPFRRLSLGLIKQHKVFRGYFRN